MIFRSYTHEFLYQTRTEDRWQIFKDSSKQVKYQQSTQSRKIFLSQVRSRPFSRFHHYVILLFQQCQM